MEEQIRELEVRTVRITGKEGLPFWTILHYFDMTINHHMKLTTIQRICELTARDVPDNHFIVAAHSVDLYQQKKPSINQFKEFTVLESKSRDPKKFWDLIVNLKRPVVFYDNGSERIPLYDFTNEEALRVTSFQENSPFTANLEGAGGTLVDLYYAKEREERLRNEQMNRYLGQAAENIERIVRASQIIEDPRTPQGVRFYAMANMERIMNAQERLNNKVGINEVHIDRRI